MTACPWCSFDPPVAFAYCPECGAGLEDEREFPVLDAPRIGDLAPAQLAVKTGTALDALSPEDAGVPIGALILLAGNPGVGKSTLALLVADGWASGGGRGATVWTFEEAPAMILARAQRAGLANRDVRVLERWPVARLARPRELWVLDSVQRADIPGVSSPLESQAHAVDVAHFVGRARNRGELGAALLLSHATKDGDVAGVNALKHDVDIVLTLNRVHSVAGRVGEPVEEASRYWLRRHVLVCEKNRFGPTSAWEVAWPMEMR